MYSFTMMMFPSRILNPRIRPFMSAQSTSHSHSPPSNDSHGWLDSFAISMSVICAVHCLVTPFLVAVLPVLASTFWVHESFHLWMLALVVPLAILSLYLGCRKHKRKLVLVLGAIGVTLLTGVAGYETFHHSAQVMEGHAHCAHCLAKGAGKLLNGATLTNVAGAGILAFAHVHNFMLCRQADCCHD